MPRRFLLRLGMSHNLSERQIRARMIEFGIDPDAKEKAGERDKRHARRIVSIWNARAARGRPALFYPTIGAALAARHPWLQVLCPGCQTVGEVDLRKIDRHHGAPISSLIPALSCRRCCPHPPFARLIGMAEHQQTPTWRDRTQQERRR